MYTFKQYPFWILTVHGVRRRWTPWWNTVEDKVSPWAISTVASKYSPSSQNRTLVVRSVATHMSYRTGIMKFRHKKNIYIFQVTPIVFDVTPVPFLSCPLVTYLEVATRKLFYLFALLSGSNFSKAYIKPFGAGIIFLILAHPVYKMWITQEPNTLELWNKLHFEGEKKSIYHV